MIKNGIIKDGINYNVNPDELQKGDLLLWYEDENNWGVAVFDYYSVDGGIYACDIGAVIDSHVVGVVKRKEP